MVLVAVGIAVGVGCVKACLKQNILFFSLCAG